MINCQNGKNPYGHEQKPSLYVVSIVKIGKSKDGKKRKKANTDWKGTHIPTTQCTPSFFQLYPIYLCRLRLIEEENEIKKQVEREPEFDEILSEMAAGIGRAVPQEGMKIWEGK